MRRGRSKGCGWGRGGCARIRRRVWGLRRFCRRRRDLSGGREGGLVRWVVRCGRYVFPRGIRREKGRGMKWGKEMKRHVLTERREDASSHYNHPKYVGSQKTPIKKITDQRGELERLTTHLHLHRPPRYLPRLKMRIQALLVTPLALPILVPKIARQMLDRRRGVCTRATGRLVRARPPRLHRVRRGDNGLIARGRPSQSRGTGGSGDSEAAISLSGAGARGCELKVRHAGAGKSLRPGRSGA